MATLRWGGMPGLVTARASHACCAVRGKLVVLGGSPTGGAPHTSSVEMLSSEEGAFVAANPAGAGGVRRDYERCSGDERRLEAGSE
jgi:hypothetical protein